MLGVLQKLQASLSKFLPTQQKGSPDKINFIFDKTGREEDLYTNLQKYISLSEVNCNSYYTEPFLLSSDSTLQLHALCQFFRSNCQAKCQRILNLTANNGTTWAYDH